MNRVKGVAMPIFVKILRSVKKFFFIIIKISGRKTSTIKVDDLIIGRSKSWVDASVT